MRRVRLFYRYFKFSFLVIFCTLNISVRAQNSRIDSLLHVISTQKDDTFRINTLQELANSYLTTTALENEKNGEIGFKQLALSQKLHYKKGMAYGYMNRSAYYRSKREDRTALVYDKKALALMQEIDYRAGISLCFKIISIDYGRLGEHEDAINFALKNLVLKKHIADQEGIAEAYSRLGKLYSDQTDYSKALGFHLNALKIREKLGVKVKIAQSYTSIANVFFWQDKISEALNYYFKSVKISEELNDPSRISYNYTNIGSLFITQKKYKDALVCFFKSLRAQESLKNPQILSSNYTFIGDIYSALKDKEHAMIYYLKAIEVLRNTGYKREVISVYRSVGDLYSEKGNRKKALYYYEQSLKLAKEIDLKPLIQNAYEGFAFLYKREKQFDKALEYTILFNNVKDSILNKENFKQVSELSTRYETDKKEKEILLLTKDQELKAKIIKQQQLVRWGLICGLILLFISVFSIYRRYRFKQKANVLLEKQKLEIEHKNSLITDSIDYAKTIQEAVLPANTEILKLFPQSFILYKPKDIVSGDFYWVHQKGQELFVAVADCNGHGVPGAFMSLLGYNMLENEIKKTKQITPGSMLYQINNEMIHRFSKENDQEHGKHGMDITVVCIDPATGQLQYAGAHNSLYIIRNEALIELKADKKGVGSIDKKNAAFTNHHFQLQEGDIMYVYTNGFPDQLGGKDRKKFRYQPFKELLLSISDLPLEMQQQKVNEAHVNWMGNKMDQTDDILIMGIRYSSKKV